MKDRKLFGTIKQIENFTDRLTKLSISDNGWSTEYVDKETGLHWLKYIVDDRSLFENLMLISPKPTTDELIDISFTSPYPDEVAAAATRLCIEEQENRNEYRQKLIDRLNQMDLSLLDQAGKERLKTIIQASKLTDRVNKRGIIGKHFSEIIKDADFFYAIANRAQEILNML